MESCRSLISLSRCGPAGCRTRFKRAGHFVRSSDGVRSQRFRCLSCGKSFSEATENPCRWQKKRQLNAKIFILLNGGFSQRRVALSLFINRKTVARKFVFLGVMSLNYLKTLNALRPKAHHVQFDEMESFEHTKCKPLSIHLAVVAKERRILGFQVSSMPAKGKLSHVAKRKYGPRPDDRAAGREQFFSDLKPLIIEDAVLESDQNPNYPKDVRRHFPKAEHRTHKGRRGCVVGQGELKRGGKDPLFSLNHTFAMIRDNVKRLMRRTWCTTKRPDRLYLNLAIYALYHNEFLLNPGKPKSIPQLFLN